VTRAACIASGTVELTGETISKPGTVWIINNEDPRSEIVRRMIAIREKYGLARPRHRISILGAPEKEGDVPLILAHKDDRGNLDIHEKAFDFLEQFIIENKTQYVSIDPFISVIRGAVSNDNDAIAAVAERLRRVTFKTRCAINVVAHTKKPDGKNSEAMAGDQGAVRGASALVDFARIVYTVVPMSEATARAILGKTAAKEAVDDLRHRYFRLDAAKGNLSRKATAQWYTMESVSLGNGDNVGVPVHVGPFSAVLRHTGIVAERDLAILECAERLAIAGRRGAQGHAEGFQSDDWA
jgi:hypothetical protein